MRLAVSSLVVLCLSAGAPVAHALEVRAELGIGASATRSLGNVLLVSPLFELATAITPDIGFQLEWGLTVARAASPLAGLSGVHLTPGNPCLSFPLRWGEGIVVAPGFTLPVTSLPSADADLPIATAAANGGRALRGTVDSWLWFASEFSLVFPLHVARWVDPFLFEAEATLAYVIPVTKADKDDDFVLQATGRVAWRVVPRVWVGMALGLVYIPTNTGDNAQTSLAPELRYAFGADGHIEARILFNLDTPFGPSFQAGRVWGFHLGGGMTF